jgi:hypothetical protein
MAKGKTVVVEGCPDVPRIELSESDLLKNLHIQPQEGFSAHGESIRRFSVDVYDPYC